MPIFKNGEVIGVLDVDSDSYDMFDEVDRINLEEIARLVSSIS